MDFSLGGSTGKYWNAFANNFKRGDKKMFGGGLGTFTASLGQSRDYLATQGGGTIGNELLHRDGGTKFNTGLKNMANTGQHWSEQLNPLWEGGLSGTKGTLHQKLLPWMKETQMKLAHHGLGANVDGYGSSGESSGGSSGGAVVASESEDPSLLNQGNWQAASTIDTFMRRENMMNRGGLETDLTTTQRGRQSTANLS
jgi:hypothetical protein